MFVLYANGTMFFNYTGLEDHIGTFAFIVQSYGNGTLDLRFKGGIPTQITSNAATSAYSKPNSYQELTYTAAQGPQTSSLVIRFFTNPRFSLLDGLLVGAAITVAVIVIRIAYMVLAPTPEERYKRMKENQKIVIMLMLVLSLLAFGAALFP